MAEKSTRHRFAVWSSSGSVYDSIYAMKPINKLATHGLSSSESPDLADVKESKAIKAEKSVPNDSPKTIKQPAVNPKDKLSPEKLTKLTLRTCTGVDGSPISYIVAGCFKCGVTPYPLRYLCSFSQRPECWPFLDEFVVRRRAACAAVLLAHRLGVKVTQNIAESVNRNDFAFYYPIESKELGLI